MTRLETPGVEPREGQAADAINELASDIEQLCYAQDAQDVARPTVLELHRCFRVLKRASVFYRGDDHVLVWEPSDGKFRPKKGTTD
jgi:hypothetical protein